MRGILLSLGLVSLEWLRFSCRFLWCKWAVQRHRNRFLVYCGRLQVCSSPDEHWRAPGELCRNKWGWLIILPFPNCWCFGEPEAAFGACCWEIYRVRWRIGFEVSSTQYSITDNVYVVLLASVSFFMCPWLWYQLIFSFGVF